MFEVLIREAAARYGLGDKALPAVQMLLTYMTGNETGGLAGFLDKFKAAGLGPVTQSWLGGGPAAQPVSNSQLETVLGANGGLLQLLTGRLDLPRDNVTSALGYLLPAIVGKLTPGGGMASSLPPEIASLAAAGQSLLASPVQAAAAASSMGKWLPWIIVVVVVLLGLIYFGKNHGADNTAPPVAATPTPAASAQAQPPARPGSSAGGFGP